MAPYKNLGSDGLPMEFYQAMQQPIKEDFYNLYLQAFKKGSLGLTINGGIIRFIPKGKKEDTISGWRPITLQITSYKIIAKALAIRIKFVVQEIVKPKQTRFIVNRFILDNLMLA